MNFRRIAAALGPACQTPGSCLQIDATSCCLAGLLLAAIAASPATAAPLSMAKMLDICTSASVPEASWKGDALGWKRVDDDPEWRSSFEAYNGGTVEVVGWRAENKDDGALSFWIATGPNGHRACSYSVENPAGLLDALTGHFGTPDTLDKFEFGVTAFWAHGSTEVSYSQVGASAGIVIGDRR